MARFKVDTQRIKQLLREKVEYVAVGVAGFLALLLLGIGLVSVFGSGSRAGDIKEDAVTLKRKLDSADPGTETAAPTEEPPPDGSSPPPAPKKDAEEKIAWTLNTPGSTFVAGSSWYDANLAGDNRKRNPTILPIDVADRSGKGKFLQIDAIVSGFSRYDISQRDQKIWALETDANKGARAGLPPVEYVGTEHLILVHATFPYLDQMEQYRKALRLDRVQDVYLRGLMPTFAGLLVRRRAFGPDGKVSEFEKVYFQDKDGNITAIDPVKKVLGEAVYDQETVYSLSHVLAVNGGATPLPRLPYGKYPEVALEGIVVRGPTAAAAGGETPPGGAGRFIPIPGPMGKGGAPGPGPMPMGGEAPMGGGGLEVLAGRPTPVPLKSYPRAFADRVTGKKINYFSPWGVFPEVARGAANTSAYQYPAAAPGMEKGFQFNSPRFGSPSGPGPMGPGPMGAVVAPGPGDTGEGADPTQKASAISGLSKDGKVLVRFVDAGLQPGYYYQYEVVVRMVNPNFGKPKEVAYPALAEKKVLYSPPVYTPWVKVPREFDFYVVDQKSLETKGRKGIDRDPIYGNLDKKIPIQIHQWIRETREGAGRSVADWVVGERLLFCRGETIERKAVEIEVPTWNALTGQFELGIRPPSVKGKKSRPAGNELPVDFGPPDGGPVVVDFTAGPPGKLDEANIELLVMSREGKLYVRNSRDDSDPEMESGHRRLERYEAWKKRVQQLRQGPISATPNMPGDPSGMNPMSVMP
ncbi:MAG: hypothetical protein IT429_12620 [Gemmataceae bacterium]|nr:hypothetical protein [Gemmataceae bacterium]